MGKLSISERIATLEAEVKNLCSSLTSSMELMNSRLKEVSDHSNDDITALYRVVEKQQVQIDSILKECLSRKIQFVRETAEMKLTNKVLYVIGGGVLVGVISLMFDFLGKVFGV